MPPLPQEANNRIAAINTRISSISATAAQQSQVNALQAVVAKLAADQRANDARVSAAMQDVYASIRFALSTVPVFAKFGISDYVTRAVSGSYAS
jgi:hypothetical protein